MVKRVINDDSQIIVYYGVFTPHKIYWQYSIVYKKLYLCT